MFARLLEKIAITLESARIRYMVIGGQAVLRYGEARLTKDVDITLGMDMDRLGDLLRWWEDWVFLLWPTPRQSFPIEE